jgi:hypothetical protein
MVGLVRRQEAMRTKLVALEALNEGQRDRATVTTLAAEHAADAKRISVLEQKPAEVNELKQQLSAVARELKTRDDLVAQR